MKKIFVLLKNSAYITLISSPLMVAGQSTGIVEVLNLAKTNVLKPLIAFFMVLATVIFLWGVITYITAGGVEEKIKEGRTYMLWGLIGLFVMIAVWGLVAVIGATFPGVHSTNAIPKGPG